MPVYVINRKCSKLCFPDLYKVSEPIYPSDLFEFDHTVSAYEHCAHYVKIDSEPVYPSVWFKQNPNNPRIEVNSGTPARLYSELILMVNGHRWVDRTVSSFMVAVIEENPQIFQTLLTAEWRASGRLIAANGANASPLSLLTVERGAALQADMNPQISTIETRRSAFWAILMIYRKTLTRSVNDAYGLDVGRRLNAFFQKTFAMNTNESDKFVGCTGEDKLTDQYRKLISAIDMFYFKFSSSKYSNMRIATLPSRYRGCDVMMSFSHISRAVGLTPEQLALFIFTNTVMDDFIRIAKADEGPFDVDDYFPYQLDFGLTIRSAYSMSANPTLYLWLHTIGALIGYTPSIKAKMVPGFADFVVTINTAAAVALHLSKAVKPSLEATKTAFHATGESPVGIEANLVLADLKLNPGLSVMQFAALKLSAQFCKNAPNDTVGDFLRFRFL